MNQSLTVVYYTSNRESPEFEERIIQELLKSSAGTAIVSVSQRPLNLGKNICVGDVGTSAVNARRQCLLGAREAKTDWVCTAEADFLYPPEYFLVPRSLQRGIWSYSNIRIVWSNRGSYRSKRCSDGAVLGRRKDVIRRLERLLHGFPEWTSERLDSHDTLTLNPGNGFVIGNRPIVTIKTRQGMSWACPFERHSAVPEIEHWGAASDLKRRLGV